MNPAQLLAHFDRMADAPDAVPRLRQFVLDLAVRGKLVEPDLNDEPAAELLKRIASEKVSRLNRGELKPQQAIVRNASDPPFATPESWRWAQLDDYLSVSGGMQKTPARTPKDNAFPYLGVGNVYRGRLDLAEVKRFQLKDGELERYRLVPGDILVVEGNGSASEIGRCARWSGEIEDCVHQNHIIRCRPFVLDTVPYILTFLNSPIGIEVMKALAVTSSGLYSLSVGKIRAIAIPLPPLAEQRRIVAKVDELMALCDKLEAAQTERESRRDRLVRASLTRLNQPDDDATTFRDHARFSLDNLPRLVTRPEHVKELRQTILNLAVRGKLVPQDPNDEPAAELLQRVVADVRDYARENRLPSSQHDTLSQAPAPFPVSGNWEWTKLAALCRVVTDGDHLPPPKSDSGVAFLTIGNITTGRLDFSNCRFVPPEYMEKLPAHRKPAFGDLLYTVVGATYGRPVLVDSQREFCVQRHIAILKPASELNLRFLFLILASPFIYDQATRSTTGTAQPTIALRPLRNFLIPLPPLAEQRRIVAKVDELMAVCDQLEAHLTTAQTGRGRLLAAVLHDALQQG